MRRRKKESRKKENQEKSNRQQSSPETKTPDIQIDPQAEVPISPNGQDAEPGGAKPVDTTGLTAEEMSYLEQLQRLQAEFTNYRRRIQKERAQWDARAKGEVLAGLLPILDDLGRARAAITGKPDGKDAEGLLMVLSRFDDFIDSIGLEMQDTSVGTPFDPNRHEAFMTGASDEYAEGMILQTFQPGYTYQDLLLRPARVQVSSGPEDQPSEADGPEPSDSAEPQPSEAGDPGEAR